MYNLKTQNRELEAKLSICQEELTQIKEVTIEGQKVQISKLEHFVKEFKEKNINLSEDLLKQKEILFDSERQNNEFIMQIKALKSEASNILEQND